MNPWLIAGMAGLGAGKHFLFDKPAADRQRKMASETTRYSPWTGTKGEVGPQPSLFNSILQGATGGMSLGQGIAQANQAEKLNDAYTGLIKAKTSAIEGSGGAPVIPAFSQDAAYGRPNLGVFDVPQYPDMGGPWTWVRG